MVSSEQETSTAVLGIGFSSISYSLKCKPTTFFFFKQKTAYEIGLGIPAEPLFRSGETYLPPREISMKDVFRSGDSSKKFKIAEGQWYRYAPSYVSPDRKSVV